MRIAVAALLLLAACDLDPRGRCAADGECLVGQVCAGGVCRTPANEAPLAEADVYPVSTALLCAAADGLLANDSDPDGDPLEAEKVGEPAHGVAFVEPNGAFRYVPVLGYTGPDAFTYRVTDGALWSAVTTVSLTVQAP